MLPEVLLILLFHYCVVFSGISVKGRVFSSFKVILLQDVEDDEAEELVKKCPVKVFDIEDLGRGGKRATVARPRDCTLCRECIRGEGWEKVVALQRVKDHFICK